MAEAHQGGRRDPSSTTGSNAFRKSSASIYENKRGSLHANSRPESTSSNIAIISPRLKHATSPTASFGTANSSLMDNQMRQEGLMSKSNSMSRQTSHFDELRSRYGTPPVQNIPPRQGSPSQGLQNSQRDRPPVPGSLGKSAGPRESQWYQIGDRPSASSPTGGSNLDDISNERKAAILGRHLHREESSRRSSIARRPSGEEGEGVFEVDVEDKGQSRAEVKSVSQPKFGRATDPQRQGITSSSLEPDPTLYPRPHHSQGGDITNDLYRWQAQVSLERERKGRSQSFSEQDALVSGGDSTFSIRSGSKEMGQQDPTLDIGNMKEPGGMRRNYLHRVRASERNTSGHSSEHEPDYFGQSHDDGLKRPNALRSNTMAPNSSQHATRFAPLVKTYGTAADLPQLSTLSASGQAQSRPGLTHSQTAPLLDRNRSISGQRRILTKNFIDFLMIYGHFAGEDLGEDDSSLEDEEDSREDLEAGIEEQESAVDEEENVDDISHHRGRLGSQSAHDRAPLLDKSNSRRTGKLPDSLTRQPSARSRPRSVPKMSYRNRSKSAARGDGEKGTATSLQAVMMLLKSFVGTGVLFMGRAFYNGGMGFSMIALLIVALISLYSFLLLVKTRLKVPGGYGEIGGKLYGDWMRSLILSSIALSQIGFVCAYTIFTAETLHSFFFAVTDGRWKIPTVVFILLQLLIFLPLAWIRNLAKLSGTALVADAFILLGLMYLYYYNFWTLAHYGVADIEFVNGHNWALFIGTAVFTFEGVGLIIPITESMAEPEKFPKILAGVMVVVMAVFTSAGATSYAAYGSKIETVVILNLPQDDRFVNAVQFLYSIAIMLSTPLQLFPAIRIIENGIFTRSGKYSNKVKWQKNTLRAAIVVFATMIAWIGAADLDKFVALLGSFACVPLCYIFPPLLHYRARADSWRLKILDIALICFGMVVMLFTSIQTITLITQS